MPLRQNAEEKVRGKVLKAVCGDANGWSEVEVWKGRPEFFFSHKKLAGSCHTTCRYISSAWAAHWSKKLHFGSTSYWIWVKIARSICCTGLRNQKNSFLPTALLFVLLKLSKDCTVDLLYRWRREEQIGIQAFAFQHLRPSLSTIGGQPHTLAEQRKMGTFLFWKNIEKKYARKKYSGNDLIVTALTWRKAVLSFLVPGSCMLIYATEIW